MLLQKSFSSSISFRSLRWKRADLYPVVFKKYLRFGWYIFFGIVHSYQCNWVIDVLVVTAHNLYEELDAFKQFIFGRDGKRMWYARDGLDDMDSIGVSTNA